MVPDQVFDELLVELSGAELKVLLYIIRRTFGFKKESDAISLNQMLRGITTREGQTLDRGSGLSKPTLLAALRSLIERGIVVVQRRRSQERGDEATVYRLRMKGEPEPEPGPQDKDTNRPHRGGKKTLPGGWSKKLTTQDTVEQDTDISNIRKREHREKELEDVYAQTSIVVEDAPPPRRQEQQGYPNQHKQGRTTSGGFVSLADELHHRKRKPEGRGSGERDAILSRIEQFAQEFGDRASLKSSTSRAYNLFVQSGISREAFLNCLWEARAITRERSGQVKSKMGYFFSVLSERLGLTGTAKGKQKGR